ncbi:MAG: DNA polymerase IV, partial [Steroidobacteraceae bacterium]|nr:DNA polymerase IV [Steroidobacteraceae bacterium]
MSDSRAILHVDMDAFYASVEEQDNPELRGKPVIVGGSGARGVVAAANYVARQYGVRSAMPMREALRRCPGAVCIHPRLQRYQEVSRQVFAIFHEFTPLVQGIALDEAYLDVTASRRLHGDEVAIAQSIKAAIRARTGLTASVGVAPNKLVAKIASDLDKPDGLTVIPADRIHAILDPLPVKRLPGLGRKKGDAVIAAGIATLGQLRTASDAQLRMLFGRDFARMRARAAGQDDRPVQPERDEQSISAEETFERDIDDVARLLAEATKLADRVAARLRARGLLARVVEVKIRRDDFATFSRQRLLGAHGNDGAAIARVARELVQSWLQRSP